MQKIILYTIFIVVSFLSKVVAQEKTFEKQVKETFGVMKKKKAPVIYRAGLPSLGKR